MNKEAGRAEVDPRLQELAENEEAKGEINAVRRAKGRRQGGLRERPGWCLSQPANGLTKLVNLTMAMHCQKINAVNYIIMGEREKNRSLYAEETEIMP